MVLLFGMDNLQVDPIEPGSSFHGLGEMVVRSINGIILIQWLVVELFGQKSKGH